MKMPYAWLNGRFFDESTASIPLRDTGLLHGAGVFTTMRSYGGRVVFLQQHLQRLRSSCEALFIPLQFADERLTLAVPELLERNELNDARLRITVTRGAATQDPVHGLRLEPHVFVTAAALQPYPAEYYERGMTVTIVDDQKLNPYDITAGHKTLNYFSRLAALRNANRLHAGEALWFDVHHFLQSGSISNVFIVKNGELLTPPTNQELRESGSQERSCVLPGITRAAIIDLALDAGLNVHRRPIDLGGLLDAEEVFITNSIMQIMPVCRIERKAVGSDRPGEITRRLMQMHDQLRQTETA